MTPTAQRGLGRAALLVCLLLSLPPTEAARRTCAESAGAPTSARCLFTGYVENRGQWETASDFVADFGNLLVRAEPGAIVIQREELLQAGKRIGVVRLAFEGAADTRPEGRERVPGEHHYFHGNDPSTWRRHVPAYRDLVYPALYPGTDVRVYERDGRPEYDVLLSPSADLDAFVVRCEGVDGLVIDGSGNLRMDTPLGPLVQHAPQAWQLTADGGKVPLACTFCILDDRRFGLDVPDRTPGGSLLIDPGLTWSTFLGGAGQDRAIDVAVLEDGSVVVLGRTASPDFPTTPGVLDTTLGVYDSTLTCLDPTGSALVFSTFVGGSDVELPLAMTVASDGRIGISGWTESLDYPTSANAYDASFNGGLYDAFVSVLNADGSDLLFSTMIGGTCQEE